MFNVGYKYMQKYLFMQICLFDLLTTAKFKQKTSDNKFFLIGGERFFVSFHSTQNDGRR